ncbi:pyridine nucleotide-disulfide oxidoreductase [Niabella ginsenosidivorans]|uniref:Pyridine nucleotide-disulfide oxidoreductase n=1 Tax=Niabella ginsenosidivorans TaxID=1176587 RepID=A0A1A9HXK0_9BACT|nr:NAD(P)/FAD-dependent oxidoreductase [Niabella ginsenosidivorans]ANH79805.1 pyridine nucleotide-disulfide oxidoreductase [Niabella ginsenosidivorans]
MPESKHFDVIIIGGSYAGLSAAMALGRSLRNVLIIDSGLPCNRQTPHSHNFITQDGAPPEVIAEKARAQVLNYDTVKLHNDLAVSGTKTENGFAITTGSGVIFHAKKLIFATGIKDLMPGIKGFAACWGISVIHCPYCHGYEFRGQPTGILANGDRAFHIASLVNNLSNDITILTSGKAGFTEAQRTKLHKHSIRIIETPVTGIEHGNGHLKNVVFDDGSRMHFTAVYAVIPFTQHSDIPVSLGCELTEQGYIKTDSFQKTTVEGIFACGDNTSPMRSVANAVSAGNFAGAMANMELTNEQF